jgi:hypothetical protein
MEPGMFDAAVCSLVLCSVPDQAAALEDLHNALRKGGELRFLEHVRGEGATKVRIQHGADRLGLWPALAGGCHASRDTVGAIRGAGFEIENLRSINLGPSWSLTNPHVVGVARKHG